MKKVFFAILLITGFILTVSESESFLPNVIGLCLCWLSVSKLKLFEA
jgi:hypothetical protein